MTSNQAPRTRFAPSPTGQVHIGNIRTAIFNWLHARHCNGQFLIRIEDTDRERSTPDAVQTVFDELEWLGLDFDEAPVYQSANRDRHLAAAEDLLTRGLAYREDVGNTGKGECVVFRMPERDLQFRDEVKGNLKKKADDMKDLVIVRSDGNPVFHLANVVDDIDMNVTLVMRGDDHVENTFRHIALYEALGAPAPQFAHLPMIVNAHGKPYAKRDGDAFVGDFRKAGYEAATIVNYLALLGWNPGDEREQMSRTELIEAFKLSRVQSSPARMDFKKLDWLNGETIRAMNKAQFKAACLPHLADRQNHPQLDAVLALMQTRTKKIPDIAAQTACFFDDDYPEDDKMIRKRLVKEENAEKLKQILACFQAVETWDAESLDRALHESFGDQTGRVMQPLRLATTGQISGPEMFPTLELLGRERVTHRLQAALDKFFFR